MWGRVSRRNPPQPSQPSSAKADTVLEAATASAQHLGDEVVSNAAFCCMLSSMYGETLHNRTT